MAITRIDFQVFDVGQGSCNYVRIWDDASPRVQNVLIDLGTHSRHAECEEVMNTLATEITEESGGHIDVVVITHGDGDHYNLVLPLLERLPDATIGNVFYGTARTGRFDEVLKTLERHCPFVTPFGPSETDYDPASGTWGSFWSTGVAGNMVNLRLLVANIPCTTYLASGTNATRDYRFNTQSAVVGIEWNDAWMIAAG
ncbi:MAG: MBL fold metallo-hydrolase, partial [Alphaproteobacteria bacterium]|nr:MBL fold metallo-hydrolase [Alphaproteobacteria bacterium]